MKYLWWFWVIWLSACRNEPSELAAMRLNLIPCAGNLPVYTERLPVDTAEQSGPRAAAALRYGPDELSGFMVRIYEYANPFDAYAALLRHGLPSDGLPRLRGEILETWFHQGKWLFVLQSNRFRPLSAELFHQFLEAFAPGKAEYSDLFGVLPVRFREPQGASVSKGAFWGVDLAYGMLCQRYRDSAGSWSAAISTETVDARDVEKWTLSVDSAAQKSPRSALLWTFRENNQRGGAGICRGRMLVVWGNRDKTTLLNYWLSACDIVASVSGKKSL